MEKLNLVLEFEELIKTVETKARSEFDIHDDDEVEDFKLDFKDRDCKKVCITIGGKEYCWCL